MSTPFVLERTTVDLHVAGSGRYQHPVLLLADEVIECYWHKADVRKGQL